MLSEIRELFRVFDTNNDRSISATELGKAMRFLGMTPSQQEIADAMRALDINGMSYNTTNKTYNTPSSLNYHIHNKQHKNTHIFPKD